MTPDRRLGHQPALDGLRGLAALLVVGYHARLIPGGYLGVDIFFVLSGFLITMVLLEEWQDRSSISLMNFYARRALRLLPALWVFLAIYSLVIALTGPDAAAMRLWGAAASVFYVANWVLAIGLPFPAELNHLWTLGTEEQFYLLWPLALLFMLHRRMSRDAVQLTLVLVIGLIALERVVLSATGAPGWRIYYGPDVRFDTILIGCLFASAFAWRKRFPRAERTISVLAGCGLGVVTLFLVLPVNQDVRVIFDGQFREVFAIAAGAIVVGCAMQRPAPVARLLSSRPFVFLGAISYALYLWHVPFFVYIHSTGRTSAAWDALATTLSFAAAVASTYLVERPFLKIKGRFERGSLSRTRL